MVRPFVGSVADVFARARRTTSKTLEMLQLALLFPYATHVCGDGRLELRQLRNPAWAGQKSLASISPEYADSLYF
jgi:hypothetical protein